MLDGEVERRRLVMLVEHLAECPDCRRALAELQRAHEETIEHLSRLVTHVPERSVEAVRRRSRARALRRRLLIAAGVALVATTAAGATIRSGVLHSLVAKLRGAPAARISPPAVRAVPETQESPAPSGIALEPHGTVEVVFPETQRQGEIRISFGDVPRVSIVATATLRYTVERSKVTIDNRETVASYLIMLPRNIPRALIRIRDVVVFAKRGAAIVTDARKDSTGVYYLPLSSGEASGP
jgi:hypothetical protein